ncbi:RING finger domain-containing protein [Giardia muris]|uniref:RING finger domain-containing protein n=1 Tax=Giardia muris TaxID=5742 RepID=A0A4Z1T4Z1_GIAMU|nr:RING finger domain-containing protein [Giardia muris]|eukprot:TNJ27589.1 RING finger domain-containing protein [Giardia muris]
MDGLIAAIEEALRCSVCHEPSGEPVVLGCGHLGCLGCLERANPPKGELVRSCPLCKIPYSRHNLRVDQRLQRIHQALALVHRRHPFSISTPQQCQNSVISISTDEEEEKEPVLKQGKTQGRKRKGEKKGIDPDANIPAMVSIEALRRASPLLQAMERERMLRVLQEVGFPSAYLMALTPIELAELQNSYTKRRRGLPKTPSNILVDMLLRERRLPPDVDAFSRLLLELLRRPEHRELLERLRGLTKGEKRKG